MFVSNSFVENCSSMGSPHLTIGGSYSDLTEVSAASRSDTTTTDRSRFLHLEFFTTTS
ncbi:hypothetical protein M6B38_217405 [Iris pallida]|uniref:Uncharacterized protein n=1 Tax=Iris pallida TaxID=29817 RepID=A0AAX6E0H9_IRIPA|nr:hypothetical protein M6B38_217405 [Iris pallida]